MHPARRRWLFWLGLAALAGIAGVCAWALLTPAGPDDQLRDGLAALERGDAYGADRFAALLELDGHVNQARYLRGRRCHHEARAAWQDAAALARRDQLAQGMQLALVRLALVANPPSLASQPLLEGVRLQYRPLLSEVLQAKARAQAAFAQAHAELSRVREHHALWPDAAALDGECLFHLGDLRAAATLLEELARRRPDDPEAYRLLAVIYYDLGAMKQAIAHALSLAALEPKNGQPHRLIGMISRDYYQVGGAIAAYREALQRQLPPGERAEVACQLAELLIVQLSKHQEALAALDQCPPGFDQQPEVLALRAECLWSLQRRDEARRLADAALGVDADLPHALRLRGTMELDEERPAAALPLLEKAVRLDPHDHKARDRLAAAYRRLDRIPSAEEQERARDRLMERKEALTKLNMQALEKPFDDQVRLDIARVWLQLARPREARLWLQAAVACNPRNPDARRLLEELTGP